jgi:hypothetical protein
MELCDVEEVLLSDSDFHFIGLFTPNKDVCVWNVMGRQKTSKLISVIALGFFVVLMLSKPCSAQNYEQTYFLIAGPTTHQLTLSVTHSLYDYYLQKPHHYTPHSFASFVTPYSLALVAADIGTLFSEEEDFVNAVLMLVHQIPYRVFEEVKYPVETIVANQGDCDLLSYVAASLIQAQEFDVVLFYYEKESHMNIGVNLRSPPRNARSAISYVDYEGTRYYMAECTGEDWQNGWRVGECPTELEDAEITVVTLENSEQIAPGQVSSSFGTFESSAVSLSVSPTFLLEGQDVILAGQVSVSTHNKMVMLYAGKNSNWFMIGTAELDSTGRYIFSWNPPLSGEYYVKASWSGDDEHAGADSEVVFIYVIPEFIVFIGGSMVLITMVAVVLLLMHKTTNPPEMQNFEVPSQ